MHFTKATFVLLLSVGLAATAAAQSANKISVNVVGLRDDDGVVRCGLYNSASTFRQPGAQYKGVIAKINGGQANCVFAAVPAGNYAVALFHAEHNESEITTGAFGKPQEGFGVSNNPSMTFGAPSFSDAAFDYAGGQKALTVRVNY
ncbi:DUF2141 domain-containing protein [Methylocystis sp. B8]|uniref:DUF2141 domain-containing protein n=1 Tax=Methylocystis sp. B8 TaxID=544938 RepID=UPI0010FCF87B|nr:DUF2141 domain-containing protein [Methylocystis sp. B8]TLG75198.1 DUF2141 domain-containing protein [Methylocystis sp. B8]